MLLHYRGVKKKKKTPIVLNKRDETNTTYTYVYISLRFRDLKRTHYILAGFILKRQYYTILHK